MIKFIHTADWHLDSPFAGLSPQQAACRRQELRELPQRLADYVNAREISLVLLCGDLFDTAAPYRDTVETLCTALGQMRARVLIAPGNHDCYGPLWEETVWPDNVYIFRENRVTELNMGDVVFHGAAFTAPQQYSGFLQDFTAPRDGKLHIGLFHGEVCGGESPYGPITAAQIASSGLDYLALGHIHKRCEPTLHGKTLTAWPGCIEGRGFDETGEKGFYQGTIEEDGTIHVDFVPFARCRYEILTVESGGENVLAAVEAALPEDTQRDIYRIVLTGEKAGHMDAPAVQRALAPRFYALEVTDARTETEDIWARAGEDSLRGVFLAKLRARYDEAPSEALRQRILTAARFGVGALERRDLG